MRVVVIGGCGHIGTYLVPRLVGAGHDVVVLSRGRQAPYLAHGAWSSVQRLQVDRAAEEQAGTFGRRLQALHPDALIDLICFEPQSARLLVESLRGAIGHLLLCGTIWVHGPSAVVPTTEDQPRRPFDEYGRKKAEIETYLLHEAHQTGFPATILHPGHIVGPGWAPVNPAGHLNPQVFAVLARGQDLALPNLGLETVHHVHADDVARIFVKAMQSRGVALGESFHVVSPAALTLRGYAEAVAGWFGQPARLRFLPWEEWRGTVSPEEAEATWSHIAHSPNCSIAKAQRLLDFRPRYSSLEAVYEAVQSLIARQVIDVPPLSMLAAESTETLRTN
jgi:nucleoside-diphosphate-sugar epimerase